MLTDFQSNNMYEGLLMSLLSNREAIGLSIEELSNRLASLYNTKLSPKSLNKLRLRRLN